MKRFFMPMLVALLMGVGLNVSAQQREADFNFDWRFSLTESKDIPAQLPLDDTKWREVRLPHDWSVEFSFDEKLEGCTGYLPGGIGWYQKHFETEQSMDGKRQYILFDGVYNNAQFWINGKRLGINPYGYSPVFFDITDHLKAKGEENIISVFVDHSRYADSRWYTGSGIYRNVKLITVNDVHVPIWGTFVTTPEVSKEQATVQIEIQIENTGKRTQQLQCVTEVYDRSGRLVAATQTAHKASRGKKAPLTQTVQVKQPELWSPETPVLYTAVTKLKVGNNIVDEVSTRFGIRSLRFDKDHGFFLNEVNTYVKGVCLHHDAGLVGTAVPKDVWRRRLEKLKEGGCNAIRTSHNPFSAEFLDLCDEMGFLVQNELFDEMDNPKDKQWNQAFRGEKYITEGYDKYFQEWAQSDLTRTILRDRNHPCVFEWSIGNEIEWTYEHYKHVSSFWDKGRKGGYWNAIPQVSAQEMKDRYNALPDRKYKLAETAEKLAKWVKELDITRPVTSNLILPVASCASGYAGALDVVGFSYQIAQYNWCKQNYPNMHFTGSENTGLLTEWNSILENPMVFSMYMWTGIDYIGESNQKWPQKGWDGDLMDFAGFTKQKWNYFKSIWVNEPHLSIGTQLLEGSLFKKDTLDGKALPKNKLSGKWHNTNSHWNYKSGEEVIVEVCSNMATVELFLNGVSLGCRSMSECPDRIFRWIVPFEEGTLTAKAGFASDPHSADLSTTKEAVGIVLKTDKVDLKADGYEVAHCVAQLVDADGNPVQTEEADLTFEVNGVGNVLGVDNGWNKSTQDYQSNKVTTHNGRALLIVQSLRGESGTIEVSCKSKNFKSNAVRIVSGKWLVTIK